MLQGLGTSIQNLLAEVPKCINKLGIAKGLAHAWKLAAH